MTAKHLVETERREQAGLPVLECLNCGARNVRHWEPPTLDGNGLYIPGFYICEASE